MITNLRMELFQALIATRQAAGRQWRAMPHTGPGLRVTLSRCHVSREDILSPENNDVSVSTVAASYITVRSSRRVI